MTRFTLACAAALVLAGAPALAQDKPGATQAAPGSEAWLRMHGETNANAPMSEQDPTELAATAKLNGDIAAANAAADRTDAENQARFDAENERWRQDTAQSATAQAQWEADVAAADAARQQWERDRAAWEAQVAACRASGRVCIAPEKN